MTSRVKIKNLIRDLEVIERECLPDSMRKNDDGEGGQNQSNVDAFTAAKRDLGNLLKELEEGIMERDKVVEEFGRCQKSVELRTANEKLLGSCTSKYEDLKSIYEKEASKKKPKYSEEQLKAMGEFVQLAGEEMQSLENAHNKRGKEKKQTFARDLRDQRAADRAVQVELARNEGREIEPQQNQPVSAQTQAFLEQKAEHDLEFGKDQDDILQGVIRLRLLAEQIGNELDAQDLMINDIDKEMDTLVDKFKVSNKQLKALVRDSGGTSRWCVLLFLFIILIALVGYMFNLISF
eukprot:TRINITY_DN13817_c1_g1_i1.p1 TRINITY_DN13817_c1_g1~~TRINITY_DN13817_c1_g1_i1.p1  ORF type:complete len:293 (+),score=84.16 TRINITY_DN13817_c1_g1_i1:26-904(+)